MKKTVLFTVLLAFQVSFSAAFAGPSGSQAAYPKSPDAEMTPGDTCHNPSSHRYPERIPYCERNVESKLKASIIRQYDSELGYRIQTLPRGKFKIDHYIPLCMGGSNEVENLWPQHESVYKITDPLEQKLCEKMAEGKMLQAEAIDLIKRAKNNLNEARDIYENALTR